MAPAILDYFATSRVPGWAGNRDRSAAPHGIFPCQGEGRRVALPVNDDAEWDRRGRALDGPEWAQDADLATAVPGRTRSSSGWAGGPPAGAEGRRSGDRRRWGSTWPRSTTWPT